MVRVGGGCDPCCGWIGTLGGVTVGSGDDGVGMLGGTGGGRGTERCKIVAICLIAFRVESPMVRHGAAVCGELSIETRSWAV